MSGRATGGRSAGTRGEPCASGEAGAVLVVIVLMVLAMFAAGVGLLVSARGAVKATRMAADRLALEARADGAVVVALSSGPGTGADSLALGASLTRRDSTDGEPVEVSWTRLRAEAWMVRANALSGRIPSASSRRLAWVYDPVERVAESPAVSVGVTVVVDRAGLLVAPTLEVERASTDTATARLCDGWWSRLEARDTLDRGPETVGVIAEPALGILDVGALLSRSELVEGDPITPRPRTIGGRCDDAAEANWGDPDDPGGPCGARFVVVGARGALTIVGGVGQGVLVAAGPIVFRAAARFDGVVVGASDVTVVDGARVRGMVVAGGSVRVGAASAVERSACRALLALAGARPSLGSAIALHGAHRYGPH